MLRAFKWLSIRIPKYIKGADSIPLPINPRGTTTNLFHNKYFEKDNFSCALNTVSDNLKPF